MVEPWIAVNINYSRINMKFALRNSLKEKLSLHPWEAFMLMPKRL